MVLRRILVGSSWTRPCEETERSGNKDFRTFLTLKRAFSNGGNEKKDAFFETRGHPWAPVGTRGHPRQLTIRIFMYVCNNNSVFFPPGREVVGESRWEIWWGNRWAKKVGVFHVRYVYIIKLWFILYSTCILLTLRLFVSLESRRLSEISSSL